jgi:uncharacterized protein YjbJ (UPF0337 family)
MADQMDKGIKNEVVGGAKEAEGRIRDGVADLTGDTSEQIKGKAEKVAGEAQKHLGRLQEDVGRKQEEHARDKRAREETALDRDR